MTSPWVHGGEGGPTFEPDYPALAGLIAIPIEAGSQSHTGRLAKAIDAWVADELRRAGFDDDEVLAALRTEFSRRHALQCGFCTPGMLITARDIVIRLGDPGEERVREELAGNLCRCTGYAGIIRAIQAAAAEGDGAAATTGAGSGRAGGSTGSGRTLA